MSRIRIALLMLLTVTMVAALAYAQAEGTVNIWDESVDGDLSTVANAPTPVAFVTDSNSLNGEIGGPAPAQPAPPEIGPATIPEGFDDGVDAYTFTVPAGFTMDEFNLTNYAPTPGNTSSGFNLWQGANGPDGVFLGSCACTTGDIGTNLLTLFGTGPLAAGDYTMEIREFGTADNIYDVEHVLPGFPVELQSFSVE